MASNQKIVDFILDQIASSGIVSAKKMFGEYALYCNDKVVALICNDQLYVKPSSSGREFIGQVEEHPPYPGAKKYFMISGDMWDDNEWLASLIKITADDLPVPKKKSRRKQAM